MNDTAVHTNKDLDAALALLKQAWQSLGGDAGEEGRWFSDTRVLLERHGAVERREADCAPLEAASPR